MLPGGPADVQYNLFGRSSLRSEFMSHLHSPYDDDGPEIFQSSSHAICRNGAEPGQVLGLSTPHLGGGKALAILPRWGGWQGQAIAPLFALR